MILDYDIRSWTPIILRGTQAPNPVLFVIPNQQLLDVMNNNKEIKVQISGTDASPYETGIFASRVLPSSVLGGFRPNFEAKTGMVGIVLLTNWEGYPRSTGMAHALDMQDLSSDQIENYTTSDCIKA